MVAGALEPGFLLNFVCMCVYDVYICAHVCVYVCVCVCGVSVNVCGCGWYGCMHM